MTSSLISPPRPRRGEGQWALGYREPLNANEQLKKDDNPLHVRARIENIYARRGFASIDPSDLRGRFRWWGLYTQRAEGFDGTKTSALEPHELEAEFFMMRVRTDGAVLGAAQLRALGEASTAYARGTADVSDRCNIQYHWVRIEDVPAIWDRLEAVGLETQEACGDSPRPFLGSPVAGVAADEILDGSPALAEIKARFIGDPELANLPRKFKTAVTGHPSHDVAPEVNDVAFVGTVHPELGPGFDLWVGGGLSTNPMLAQKLGVWVPLEEVADVWHGVIQIFRDYGYRRLRNKARLKFLVADWGVEKFREVLEDDYLGRGLVDCPSPASPQRQGDHIGVHAQKDGKLYVGVAPVVGRVDGATLVALGDVVERYAALGVRLTAYQKLVVLGVRPEVVEDLVTDLAEIGLEARPSNWRRNTMACTGLEFCKLALVDTKRRAQALVAELEQRFPALDTPITVNVNGCPNACARTQIADIGLKGQQVLGPDGEQVEGFQVHLGGALGLDANFGRKLRAHKVTSAGLDDYITAVVTAYLHDRLDGETFTTWVARADESLLTGERAAETVSGGASHERRHRSRAHLPRIAHRGPLPRGAALAGAARRRRAGAGPGPGHRRVGGRDVRRAVLRDLVDGRRRARASGVGGGARDRRGVRRHRLPLRGDDRHPRRHRGNAARADAHDHARRVGGLPGGAARLAAPHRPRPVLRAAQGGAARACAVGVRRLGDRPAPRRDARARDRPGDRVGRAPRQGQGVAAGPLERRSGRGVHRSPRHPRQPPDPRRLPLHRLRAVHSPGRPRRGPAQRPLGGAGQDRMRYPPMTEILDSAVERTVPDPTPVLEGIPLL